MRISGGYTLHHSLTAEAAATVKQAVSLARRRGHAQVSPLHVASAMLSTPGGLLKRACLQSHSHPLQCKALELCFNVALNRLPTSAPSGPLLGPHHHLPSLSNALVAAFKRAQAHQRRGSIENQQQPILALKVEVEQLVISVLDDPSVSRVMREAGFSSTHVKSNVEHSISADKSAVKISPPPHPAAAAANLSQFRRRPVLFNDDGDVTAVLDAMSSEKTRNAVVIGESAAGGEALVKKVMARFDGGGGGVPEGMESVRFISVPLSTLRSVGKEEFEVKVAELRSLVRSYVGRGVVLYLGDLGWVADFWCRHGGGERNSPVEYMIMELSRLVNGDAYNNRLWLMGVATFETYDNCRSSGGGRRPSLESLWSLHPLPLPLKTLALGLSLHSGVHGEVKKEVLEDSKWMQGIKKELVCCWDCTDNFKREAESIMNVVDDDDEELVSSSSKLPSWLQQYKDDEKRKQLTVNTQESEKIKHLSKKWNSICTSLHKKPHFLEKVFTLSSSSSPSSSASASASASTSDHLNKTHIHQDLLNWPTILDRDAEVSKPSSPSTKPELLSNPNSSPNSASSSEASGDLRPPHGLIPDNLASALEEKVPWQRHAASEVAAAVLKCRSGKMRGEGRKECWLGFSGPDRRGKEAMAREVARVVFGSDDDFVAVGISSFSPEEKRDDEAASRRKRWRDEEGGSVYDRFVEAVRDNPSRLIFVEDVEEIDRGCVKKFERVIRDGEVGGDEGEVLPLKDAIVVFCSEEREGEGEREREEEKEEEECGPLDLNVGVEEGNIPVSGVGVLDSVDVHVVFRIQPL